MYKENPCAKISAERKVLVSNILIEEIDNIILLSQSKFESLLFCQRSHSRYIIRMTYGINGTLERLKETLTNLQQWKDVTQGVVQVDCLPRLMNSSLWIPSGPEMPLKEKVALCHRGEQYSDTRISKWAPSIRKVWPNHQGVFLIIYGDLVRLMAKSETVVKEMDERKPAVSLHGTTSTVTVPPSEKQIVMDTPDLRK